MLDVFIIALMAAYNARLAKRAGQNGLLWGFLTVLSFVVVEVFAGTILLISKYKGPIADLTNPETMQKFVQGNMLMYWTMLAFGIGGGLLIRFILERMLKNKPQK